MSWETALQQVELTAAVWLRDQEIQRRDARVS